MTIACGASTQTSQSALVDYSAIPAVEAVAGHNLEAGEAAGVENEDIAQNADDETAEPEIGAGAVNTRNLVNCPTGMTAGLNGCSVFSPGRLPRPSIQHGQSAHMTNMANGFNDAQMGGHQF